MSVFGIDIQYTVGGQPDEGLRRLSLAFERTGEAFGRFGEFVFPKLEDPMRLAIGKQFKEEGRGPSGHWAPLSPAYLAQKRGLKKSANKAKRKSLQGTGVKLRLGVNQPILVLSGALREALTAAGHPPHSERAYTRTEFNFGTSGIPYASFHQTGTARMPARPMLDFAADFDRKVEEVALSAARECVRVGSEGVLAVDGAEV